MFQKEQAEREGKSRSTLRHSHWELERGNPIRVYDGESMELLKLNSSTKTAFTPATLEGENCALINWIYSSEKISHPARRCVLRFMRCWETLTRLLHGKAILPNYRVLSVLEMKSANFVKSRAAIRIVYLLPLARLEARITLLKLM